MITPFTHNPTTPPVAARLCITLLRRICSCNEGHPGRPFPWRVFSFFRVPFSVLLCFIPFRFLFCCVFFFSVFCFVVFISRSVFSFDFFSFPLFRSFFFLLFYDEQEFEIIRKAPDDRKEKIRSYIKLSVVIKMTTIITISITLSPTTKSRKGIKFLSFSLALLPRRKKTEIRSVGRRRHSFRVITRGNIQLQTLWRFS